MQKRAKDDFVQQSTKRSSENRPTQEMFRTKAFLVSFFCKYCPGSPYQKSQNSTVSDFFYSPRTVGRFAFFEEIWENPFTSPEGHMVLNNELFYRQHIKVGMIKGIPTLEIILKMIIWVILVKICPIFCVKRKNLGVHEI